MFENFYFALGLVNSLWLIVIFLLVKFSTPANVKVVGASYLLLGIPGINAITSAQRLQKPVQYSIFLAIFLAFLVLEGVYDHILKVPFRESFRKYWKQWIPYLLLYWSMNYGFIAMAWKYSAMQGAILAGLFILQLTANILSHTKSQSKTAAK